MFFRHMRAKRTHRQKICTLRNFIGSHSGGRKVIPGKNSDMYKTTKNTGNDNCAG